MAASHRCPEPQPGAIVHIDDADGTELSLPVNEMGNFWTSEPLVPPFGVAVELDGDLTVKQFAVPTLSCNLCHQLDAPMGLVSPGSD